MLDLRVFAPATVLEETLTALVNHPGVRNVVRAGHLAAQDTALVTADVEARVVDALLPALLSHGIDGDDIELVRRESSRPVGLRRADDTAAWSGGGLAWSELTMTSRQYARAVPQYLVIMTCAGIIAVFGVLTANTILVVGAMAISPDLLPMCAVCVGLTDRHPLLAVRALAALLLGLGVACLAAFLMAVVLRLGGYGPATGSLSDGGLGVLPTVNVATLTVAFVAGVAGVLAFETRSSSAVGVAISITTIPAAAYIGAAAALDNGDGAIGAFEVLLANVTMLVLAGTSTLLVQRRIRRD